MSEDTQALIVILTCVQIIITASAILWVIVDKVTEEDTLDTKLKVLKFLTIHIFWFIAYPFCIAIGLYKWWSKLEDQ